MNKTSKQFDNTKPNRCAQLKAWLALHQIRNADLAESLEVHPSMITRIINGERAPAKRISQLADFGIPEELLPLPSKSPGRPRRATNASATHYASLTKKKRREYRED